MEMFNSELNLFHPAGVSAGIVKHELVQFSAIPPINSGPLVFQFPGTTSHYISLKNQI